MKIVVTSTGDNLDSNISPVFGRSPEFIIANLENSEIKDVSSMTNPAKNERGAGNIAAQFMVDNEVKALISGKLGPVAFNILKSAGIKVYKITSGNVETNLKLFSEGKLEEITTPAAGGPGARGMGRGGGMGRK